MEEAKQDSSPQHRSAGNVEKNRTDLPLQKKLPGKLKRRCEICRGERRGGGKITRRTERQQGGGEQRGELCRGKGLSAVHGPPGQTENLPEPDPPRCDLHKSIWHSWSAYLEEKNTCFLLLCPPCLHPSPRSDALDGISYSHEGPPFQEESRRSFLWISSPAGTESQGPEISGGLQCFGGFP